MRGDTSTRRLIWEPIAASDDALREELLRLRMGVPLQGERPGNRQTTGLGRGSATSNKVFFADIEAGDSGPRLVSTLVQLAADHGRIDRSVNRGNMSSALQLWAIDTGLIDGLAPGAHAVDIRNTNTGVLTTSRMPSRRRAAKSGSISRARPGAVDHRGRVNGRQRRAVDTFRRPPAQRAGAAERLRAVVWRLAGAAAGAGSQRAVSSSARACAGRVGRHLRQIRAVLAGLGGRLLDQELLAVLAGDPGRRLAPAGPGGT